MVKDLDLLAYNHALGCQEVAFKTFSFANINSCTWSLTCVLFASKNL